MGHSTQEILRFPSLDGLIVSTAFDGGAMSSDFGPRLLHGIDRQIGLADQLAQMFRDPRQVAEPDRVYVGDITCVQCASSRFRTMLKNHGCRFCVPKPLARSVITLFTKSSGRNR